MISERTARRAMKVMEEAGKKLTELREENQRLRTAIQNFFAARTPDEHHHAMVAMEEAWKGEKK